MIRSRLGLKVLGLCAALFGLMAVTAGSAQAEAGSFWTVVNPKTEALTKITTEALLPEVQVKEIEELKAVGEEGKHAVLLTTIGATNTPIAILCSTAELKKATEAGAPKLLKEGGLLGKAKFEGCTTKLKGVLSAPCKPHSPGSPEGTIETEVAKGLIKLHELTGGAKDDTVLLAPDNANNRFVKIILGKEGFENECSAGESLTIEGELVVYDPAGNTSFTEEKIDHLITEFPGLKLLKFGTREASIDGSALIHLVGEHLNWKWSGIPG